MLKKISFVIAIPLLLAGCDGKKNIILNGERENFLKLSPKLIATSKHQPKFSGNEIANTSWPDHRGSRLLTMPQLSSTLSEVWSINVGASQTSEHRILQAPVVSNKKLYALDSVGTLTADALEEVGSSSLSKHINTPQKLWHFDTLNEEMKSQSIGSGFFSIHKDVIYIATSVGEIIALKSQDGSILWRKSGFSPFRAAPCVFGNKIVVMSANNEVTAISTTNGDRLWSHTGVTESTQLMQAATPIESANTVIVAYSSGEVYALNGTTGHPQWSDTLTPVARIDTVTGIPHISADPIIDDQNVYVISHGGKTAALNLMTGAKVWEKDVGGSINPVMYGDFIYALSNDNELVCMYKKTGDIAWIHNIDSNNKNEDRRFCCGLILAGNKIIVSTNLGEIFFFDINTGQQKHVIKKNTAFMASPIIAHNTLILMDEDANLYGYA